MDVNEHKLNIKMVVLDMLYKNQSKVVGAKAN